MYLPWVWHLLNWEFNRLLSNKHKPPWKAWILIGPTGQSYLFYLQCISYFWWQGHRKEHRLGKTCWSFINETWANLPRGPIYLKLFMGTHSLSFPSSMKELQHLRTTECVFQCNEDLRPQRGTLRFRPHCLCNFTPEASSFMQNENSLLKCHSLFMIIQMGNIARIYSNALRLGINEILEANHLHDIWFH